MFNGPNQAPQQTLIQGHVFGEGYFLYFKKLQHNNQHLSTQLGKNTFRKKETKLPIAINRIGI